MYGFLKYWLNVSSPPTPPRPEFDTPWRQVTWSEDKKNEMLKKLKEFQLSTPDVDQLKILLHGPIGAGKSSFINSVHTALQGRSTAVAPANSAAGDSYSFTTKFKFYRLKKDGSGSFYPFVFTDVMGMEHGRSKGVHTDDIISILHGHIKNGYTFNPCCPIDKENPNYISDPSLKDRVHCLVSVLPANKISLTSDDVIHKMKQVREKARDLGIPQVTVMTMVDEACPLVRDDLEKIYTSKKIKEKMQECSNKLGVPMNCIYPVKNYHEKITNDLNADILILMSVTDIISFANDYIEDQIYTE
ncbi:interferon-induced protein 44-like [Colossoma macropomum]|uniref:interferon-induced protein 44-like n=1 Tax=Colossoma macropomum TaxID=42526 RepID=UPI00186498C1|nr:interferon-induced protein 44-like [Colossoma macropomum]XP_036413715.1 interferon-induced protein 44-like [Colossoma macropomum]